MYVEINNNTTLLGKIIRSAEAAAIIILLKIATLRFPKNLIRKGAINIPIPEAVPITSDNTDCKFAFCKI